jgi:hypothetical protein
MIPIVARTANTNREAFDKSEKFKGRPNAFIQWKCTDVGMDVLCVCGEYDHIGGMFAYSVQCRACGRTYDVGSHVELIEIPASEANNPLMFGEGEDSQSPNAGEGDA